MKFNCQSQLILISLCIATAAGSLAAAQKSNAPGVSGTEIKIGQTMPYSGPASAWGTIGRAEIAYVKMINDRGGIKGRKINLISLDDGYSPPKTLEQTRKLVEGEGVAFIYNTSGPGNLVLRECAGRPARSRGCESLTMKV
jgi:branched-chain amino acid transport system substrate-binding protein